jgi:hypothetical protein
VYGLLHTSASFWGENGLVQVDAGLVIFGSVQNKHKLNNLQISQLGQFQTKVSLIIRAFSTG